MFVVRFVQEQAARYIRCSNTHTSQSVKSLSMMPTVYYRIGFPERATPNTPQRKVRCIIQAAAPIGKPLFKQAVTNGKQKTEKGLLLLAQTLEVPGAEGQNRTADTGIFSPLLYRLSYLGEGDFKSALFY